MRSSKVSVAFTDGLLQSFSCLWKHVKSFDLSDLRFITDSGLTTLLQNCNQIVSLNLTRCVHLTDRVAVNISRYCPKLCFLSLYQTKISGNGIKQLFQASEAAPNLCPALSVLVLSLLEDRHRHDIHCTMCFSSSATRS